jgi:hypothetical protein
VPNDLFSRAGLRGIIHTSPRVCLPDRVVERGATLNVVKLGVDPLFEKNKKTDGSGTRSGSASVRS